jgi:hypothetical protein
MYIHGTRVEDNALKDDPFRPGTYGRIEVGGENLKWIWVCTTPNGHHGSLDGHDVIEHEDGTITVSPSILIKGGPDWEELWHGYLEHGDWRKV